MILTFFVMLVRATLKFWNLFKLPPALPIGCVLSTPWGFNLAMNRSVCLTNRETAAQVKTSNQP